MWLKIDADLIGHAKIIKMARRLEIKPIMAQAHIIAIWQAALKHAQDGALTWDAETFAIYAQWEGDDNKFLEVLIDVELIDRRDDGTLEIHDWLDYAGSLLAAKKKREYRAKKKETTGKRPAAKLPELTLLDDDDFELVSDKTAKVQLTETLPLPNGDNHHVSEKDVEEYSRAYPGVDIGQQLRNMRQWLLANPTRRKTKRGIKRFIVSWLSKAQDRGGGRQNKLEQMDQEINKMLRG